jgi:Na+/glutamate symporter
VPPCIVPGSDIPQPLKLKWLVQGELVMVLLLVLLLSFLFARQLPGTFLRSPGFVPCCLMMAVLVCKTSKSVEKRHVREKEEVVLALSLLLVLLTSSLHSLST